MSSSIKDRGDYSYKSRKITPRRIIKYLIRKGRKIIYDSSWDYYMTKNISDNDQPESVDPGWEWRRADQADIPAFRDFLPRFKIRLFIRRFSRGEHCLVAVKGVKIIHYCWFVYELDYSVKELNYLVKVLPDKVYIYDAYTRKDFRDQGLHQECYRRINRLMSGYGKQYMITMMDRNNLNSIFTALQIGFQLRGNVIYRRILWMKRTRFEPTLEGGGE